MNQALNNEIAIVIPIYKEKLDAEEELAIRQALKVLGGYPHVLVIPGTLDVSGIISIYADGNMQVTTETFDRSYFEDKSSYNKLMLSIAFYERFASYKYILIYQTDAYIFRDELTHWMARGYDYIGAPWLDWVHTSKHVKNRSWWTKILWHIGCRRFDAVGNGGFSLRKVAKMLEILRNSPGAANKFAYNEDIYFTIEAKRLGMNIRIPSVQEALQFAFDERPELAFRMTKGIVPMGCHGWPRYYHFWKSLMNQTLEK